MNDSVQSPVFGIAFLNIPAITSELFGFYLDRCDTLKLVAQVKSIADMEEIFERDMPQVALIGAQPSRDECTGLPYLQQIRILAPQVRPIILGQDLSDADEIALLYAGARGLLREAEVNLSTLMKCIRSVAAGQVWANSLQMDRLLTSLSRPRGARVTNVLGVALLSKREEEVLHLLSEGMSNRDLASALKLSEHTVKNHLFRIFDKLGVSNRMEAVLYAMSRCEAQTYVYAAPEDHVPAPKALLSDAAQ